MRTIVIATVAAMVTTSASAMDLGYGLTLNTDVVAEHKFDAEATTMIINPELGYITGKAEWTLGTTLNIWDNSNSFTLDNEFDHAPTIDIGVSYPMLGNLELEAGTTYDFETKERGELSAKATFSF
jgi:hypothetical protein|tara:strand:- start:2652 stop:3029 length:378 start_codon:yes stop_codon:yes gene_type:complete